MTVRSFRWGLIVVASLAWFAIGCGGAANTPQPVENLALEEVGGLYRLYLEEHHKPPQKAADLARYEQGFPLGYLQIKDGQIVVQWGAKLNDLGDGTKDSAEKILAYEKKVPQEGGAVLMENRSLRTMSAEEFKTAPKAGGA